jgi:mono/diheme cytochrome c family protein
MISLAISGCEREAPNTPAGLLASREAQQAGGVIFAANCAICHGASGDGRGQRREGIHPPPANLTLPPWSEEKSAGRTYLAIRNGVPGTAMPAWSMLDDRHLWELVAYITSLNSQQSGPVGVRNNL